MTTFVHCFLLGGVVYGEADFLMLSWWCQCCCFKFSISVAGLFIFVNLLSFLAVCILYVIRVYVIADTMCNRYLRDINICFLSKKKCVFISVCICTVVLCF